MTAQLPDVLDAGLRLLDRQIVDCDERPVANVDDLEAVYDERGRPYIVAVLTGPGAWGPRVGGRLSRWITAIWRRLHPAARPAPSRIPMTAVTRVDSAVHLAVPRSSTAALALDQWVDLHVISRLPGAGDGDT
jgi:hypothetical protein